MAITGMTWCDFVVSIGKSLHTERMIGDTDFWERSVLPGLLSFYHSTVTPYLKQKGRPIPPLLQQPCDKKDDSTLAKYEQLFPSMFCKSGISGRNGSNACSLIATMFAKSALRGLLQNADVMRTEELMRSAMVEGSRLYDSNGLNLSASFFNFFNSHSHGDAGALYAKVPVEKATCFLRHFFNHRYSFFAL